MSFTENYDDMFDLYGLPNGLPDAVYATWLGALAELKSSTSSVVGQKRYQFCCGYTQALEDSGILEPRLCRFLNVQVQALWVDILNELGAKGL